MDRTRLRCKPCSTMQRACLASLPNLCLRPNRAAVACRLPQRTGNGRDWQGADLYGNQLFHGPDFAALQSVDRIGATGAEATLLTSPALHWPNGPWAMDPALIDGGLQLARMWGLAQLEKLTLPTTVERFMLHQPGLIDGPTVRCVLQGELIGQAGTRTNLWFIDDSSGAIIAELHGLEMYASSETPAGGAA